MGVRESKIENHLRNRITQLGALCEKWGENGNPDRVVIFRGKIYLVEIKTPSGHYTSQQQIKHPKYEKQRVSILTLRSMECVDRFVSVLEKNVKTV